MCHGFCRRYCVVDESGEQEQLSGSSDILSVQPRWAEKHLQASHLHADEWIMSGVSECAPWSAEFLPGTCSHAFHLTIVQLSGYLSCCDRLVFSLTPEQDIFSLLWKPQLLPNETSSSVQFPADSALKCAPHTEHSKISIFFFYVTQINDHVAMSYMKHDLTSEKRL